MPIALSSDFSRYFTPATMPSRVSLSAPFERQIVSSSMALERMSELGLANGMAIELRERSPRQASPFQDEARHLGDGTSTGAYRRPTLGLGPMGVLLTHVCLLSVLARQPAVARSSTRQSRSVCSEFSVSKDTASELGGSSGVSEFGDSDSLFSISATQEVSFCEC